jgi:hypothetical protein
LLLVLEETVQVEDQILHLQVLLMLLGVVASFLAPATPWDLVDPDAEVKMLRLLPEQVDKVMMADFGLVWFPQLAAVAAKEVLVDLLLAQPGAPEVLVMI